MIKPVAYFEGEATPCSKHRCNSPCCELYEIKLLESDVEHIEKRGYLRESFIEYEDNYLYLRKGDEGCVFQENSICTIHPYRPLACRTYPWVNMDGMIGADEFCPYSDEFEFNWDLEHVLQELITKCNEEKNARNICKIYQCNLCCRDTEMPLTNGDIRRISDLGHLEFFRERNGEYVLRNLDHRCFFLGANGRCTIYEDRPEGCRFYPFILGKGGVVMDEDCPHREDFQKRFSSWIEGGLIELVDMLEEERAERVE